jgi:hypothetical protein
MSPKLELNMIVMKTIAEWLEILGNRANWANGLELNDRIVADRTPITFCPGPSQKATLKKPRK